MEEIRPVRVQVWRIDASTLLSAAYNGGIPLWNCRGINPKFRVFIDGKFVEVDWVDLVAEQT